MTSYGTKGKRCASIDRVHYAALKAIAKQEECSTAHALKWAIRTLANARKIKISS